MENEGINYTFYVDMPKGISMLKASKWAVDWRYQLYILCWSGQEDKWLNCY